MTNSTEATLRKLGSGAALMSLMGFINRSLGVVSSIVLARMLAPDDFGVFAASVIFVAFGELVAKSGQQMAVIQLKNATDQHFNAAWTLSIIIGFILGSIVFAAAPFFADLFGEPRATLAIQILSLRLVFMGFENIGVVAFRRELNFKMEFRYNVIVRLLNVLSVIVLALWFRSYWALVFGSLVGLGMTIITSYLIHPYRPKPQLSQIGSIWAFSGWVLATRSANFMVGHLDRFVVGNLMSTASLGYYHVGAHLGRILTFDLLQPTSQAIFPSYTRLAEQKSDLTKTYVTVLAHIATIGFAISVGFALVAEDAIHLFYGERWLMAAPVASWAAVAGFIRALGNTTADVQNAKGKPALTTIYSWITVLALGAGLLLIGADNPGISSVAMIRAIALLTCLPLAFLLLARTIELKASDFVTAVYRPFFAAAAMTLAIWSFDSALQVLSLPLTLLCKVSLGAVAYISTAMLLWAFAGKPNGPEKQLLKLSRSFVAKLKK